MSDAASVVGQALMDALATAPALAEVSRYSGPGTAGVLPRLEVGEPVATDWSAKDWQGRELRTAIVLRVAEGQADRLGALRAAVEEVGEGLARDLDEWRVASAVLVRSRGATGRGGERIVTIEHRVRVMEA